MTQRGGAATELRSPRVRGPKPGRAGGSERAAEAANNPSAGASRASRWTVPLLALFFGVFGGLQLHGVEVLWRDGFEGFNLQLRWEVTAGVWGMGDPSSGPLVPFAGTNLAATVLSGDYPEGAHTMLLRRASFRVPDLNPRLRFRHWFDFSRDDYGSVQVRATGQNWGTLITYPQMQGTCGRWEWASLDLSPYAGREVQIGFLFHSQLHWDGRSYVAEGWYLDEVEVVSGPMEFRGPESFGGTDFWDHWSADNGVWEAGVPKGLPAERHDGSNAVGTIIDSYYCDAAYGRDSRLISPGTTVPTQPNPRLRFRHWFNFNRDDYGQVQVREVGGFWETLITYPPYLWTNRRWELASLDLSKYAGKEVQVGFLFHSQLHADGRSYVAEGWYLDDVELVSGPMEFRNPERFEEPDFWNRWSTDNGVWEVGAPTGHPAERHNGSNAAGTIIDGYYWDAYTGRDSRLISPLTLVPNEPNPRLRFRHWFSFSWDDFGQVQVREAGGEWEDLADGGYPQALTTCGRWERASLDLSPYAGRAVQIGFLFHSRCHSDGQRYEAEGWYLDDVEIVSGPREFRNPERFEETDFWDHWSTDNGVWEVGVPTQRPAERHDGSKAAGTILDGYYCDATYGRDSRLISPLTIVPTAPNPRLRFRHWFNFNWDDYGQVQVREVGRAWETLILYPQYLWSNNRWELASLDLAKYAGKPVQFGFLFHARSNSSGKPYEAEGWFLDDVELVSGLMEWRNPEGFEQPDFWNHWYTENGVWEVGAPTSGPGRAFAGAQVAATILDGNYFDAHYGRDSRLVSPWFRVPEQGVPTLEFQHWYHFNADDYGVVEVRAAGGSWAPLQQFPSGRSNQWVPAQHRLTGYAGRVIQVGFRFHSQINRDGRSYVGPGWYLDQVQIRSDLLRVQPETILWEGLSVAELTPCAFQVLGAPPGWKYGVAPGSPEGVAVDPELGLFTWRPDDCQGPGLYFVTLTLSNPDGEVVDLLEVPVIVLDTPEPPHLAPIPSLRLRPGVSIDLDVASHAYDLDCPAQTLTYTLDAGSPGNATLDGLSGRLRWEPTPQQASQTNTLRIRVTDDDGLSATQTVLAAPFTAGPDSNEPPVFQPIPAIRFAPSQLVTLEVSGFVSDADAPPQRLMFGLESPSPTNASLDAVTGKLEWTPTPRQAMGTNLFRFRVTDDGGLSATQTVMAYGLGPFLSVRVHPAGGTRIVSVVMSGDVNSPRFELLQTHKLPAAPEEWTPVNSEPWSIPSTGVLTYDLVNPIGSRFFRLRLSSP